MASGDQELFTTGQELQQQVSVVIRALLAGDNDRGIEKEGGSVVGPPQQSRLETKKKFMVDPGRERKEGVADSLSLAPS